LDDILCARGGSNAIKRERIGLSNGHSTGVITAPVLIVGAGPVGMMAALLLARQGVRSVLIERRSELTAHPKGRGFNARSMELFRQCGMLADMVAAQPKTEQVQHVAMGTGIDDPDLKIMPFFGASQAVRGYRRDGDRRPFAALCCGDFDL
jgi:2-polyprenyl-6-methoxyphenol hydroxylase-like FAD-dependent oxidoreductase